MGLIIDAGDTDATRQVARKIYDGTLFDKKLCRLASLTEDVREYDVVFVGFDMKDSAISETVRNFLRSLDDVQVALFATVNDPAMGRETRTALRHNREYLGVVHGLWVDLFAGMDWIVIILFTLRLVIYQEL